MNDIRSDLEKEEALFGSLDLLVANSKGGLKGSAKEAFVAMQERSKKNPDNEFLKEYVRKFDKVNPDRPCKT